MFRLEDWLRQGLAGLLGLTLPKPATPFLKRVEQLTMYRHHIATPPEPAVSDFAKRIATISVIGDDGTVFPDTTISIPKGATEFLVNGEINQKISLVLRDYDIRNNGSDPSDPLAWTVVDSVPPPKPGTLHIANVEQVDFQLVGSSTSGDVPLTVTFSTTTGEMDGTIDYGDGSTPDKSLTHTYTTPGSYLAVYTNSDGTSQLTITATGTAPVPPVPPVVPVPLGISASPIAGVAPLSVSLTVTGDNAGVAIFNSGEPGVGDITPPPPSVIYSTPGTYSATVKAGTPTEVASVTITVTAPTQ